MTAFALNSNTKAELKTKDRADLLEAFLGALYVDKVCSAIIYYLRELILVKKTTNLVVN